jgi:titin
MSLQLSVIPSNAQATVNLSWSGSQPNGIIEYLIFYYQVGSVRVKSISTTTLSTVIPNLTNGVTYNFRATAFLGGYTNGQQLTETSMVQVICCTQPDAPTNLAAIVSTTGHVIAQQIQLSWTASFSNASHSVLNYKIYLSSSNGNQVIVTPDASASYNLTGLVNGTAYTIRVSGVNLVGEGAQCSSVTATPLGLAGPPTDLAIHFDPDVSNSTSPGYQSVDLSFSAPVEMGGTTITSYSIMYSLDPSFNTNVQTVSVQGTDMSVQDANLVIPFAVIPLSWGYDIDNSTPLLGYIIAYLDTTGDMVTIYVNDVSEAPAHTITGLENGISYDFSVFGINMLGSGPSLDVSVIPSTVPDAPSVSFDHSDESIELSWSAPYDEGDSITGYNIYRSSDGYNYTLLGATPNTAYAYTDSGLVNGSNYFYAVAAENANGEGPRSGFGGEYPSTVPDAPTNITVTNSNANGTGRQLTVSWNQLPSDVSSNGGSAILEFRVRSSNGTLLGSVSASSASSYSLPISNLINGQSYVFRISAVNRDGEGSYAASSSTHPSGLPNAPAGLSVSNSNSQGAGGEAHIAINALNIATGGANVHPSDEGSTFDHFQIYRDGVAMEMFTGTSFGYGNLVNGQQYSFTLAAVNGNGEGAQCAPVTIITSCRPDVVTGLAAVHGNSQVSLSWNLLSVAPSQLASDQGSAISHYDIEKSHNGGAWTPLASVAANISSYLAPSLINGESYSFRVIAANANGHSTTSSAVSATPSTSPSAVRNVHIVGSASELHIIWDAPADANGHPSGGLSYLYNVQVLNPDNTFAYSVNGIASPHVEVENLNTSVQYTVNIFAYNSIDTNYITYSTLSTTVPLPVEITSLQWDSAEAGSLMRWNYASDTFAAIDFLLVVMDVTTGIFSSVFCPAYNAIADETIEDNGDGTYSYSYAWTHLNTETLSFADSD